MVVNIPQGWYEYQALRDTFLYSPAFPFAVSLYDNISLSSHLTFRLYSSPLICFLNSLLQAFLCLRLSKCPVSYVNCLRFPLIVVVVASTVCWSSVKLNCFSDGPRVLSILFFGCLRTKCSNSFPFTSSRYIGLWELWSYTGFSLLSSRIRLVISHASGKHICLASLL